MQFINNLSIFFGALISLLFYVFSLNKIFNLKTPKCFNNIFILMVLSIFISIVNYYDKNIFKAALVIPLLTMSFAYIYKERAEKMFLNILLLTLYLLVGEILTGIILTLLDVNQSYILNNVLGKVIGSIVVIAFAIPLTFIKPLSRLINKIASYLLEKRIYIVGVGIILIICALGYRSSDLTGNITAVLMNLIIFLFIWLITHLLLKEQHKANETLKEYNGLLKYLDKYEKELGEKRKSIHDFKNQLIIINSYASNNSKLKKYLNEIMDEYKTKRENQFIIGIDRIPKGLKGLIYYKLSTLSKSIKLNILVGEELKKIDDYSLISNKDSLKIIGILIDNAIEEVECVRNKILNLNIFIENDTFNFNISNSCRGKIDEKKIFIQGFSTKGTNRGYGLSIVTDILKSNKNITLNIKHEKNLFNASLSIRK